MNMDFKEQFDYPEGIRCRWTLPGDLFHFICNKNRRKMEPPFFAGKKYGIHDDIMSGRDPLPVIGFGAACLRYVFDAKMWKMMFKR